MALDFSVLMGHQDEAAPLADYTARDGTRLGLRRYSPSSGARSLLSLILLHGSGSQSRYLGALGRALANAGVAEVVTPDLRGHGPHPARRGDIDYADQLEDDLADLVHTLRREAPGRPVVIGGHSSGGGLALRFAGGAYGAEAAGFVLLAPFLRHDAPTTRPGSGGWAQPNVPLILALSGLNGLGIHLFDQLVAIRFSMPEAVRDGSETLAYSYRLNRGYAPRNYERDLAALHVPLLVLVGSEDEAFIADRFPALIRAHAKRADARVEILTGESHLGLVVGQAVRTPLVHWLDRLARSQGAERPLAGWVRE